MNHMVTHHPEFPLEKGKPLQPKNKLVMNTVRDLVIGILRGDTRVDLKKYTKKIDWGNPPKNLGKTEKISFDISSIQQTIQEEKTTTHKKETVKTGIHDALEKVGINPHNTNKRIRTAIESLGGQYKDMSSERFLHRLQNGKVQRDCRFLIGMIQSMSQLGKIGLQSSMNNLLSDRHYPSLNNSDSMGALMIIVSKAKEVLKTQDKKNQSKGSYKKFKLLLQRITIEVGEK